MTRKTTRKQRRVFSSMEKCKAVLSVWSERRTSGEICTEMKITCTMLSKWQDQAMAAMLEALEPRCAQREKQPALNPKLTKLMERLAPVSNPETSKLNKLEQRLEKVQKAAT